MPSAARHGLNSKLVSSSSSSSTSSALVLSSHSLPHNTIRQHHSPILSSSFAAELPSLCTFLIDLCVQPPGVASNTCGQEQRSIARYILARWTPELDSEPTTYNFLSSKLFDFSSQKSPVRKRLVQKKPRKSAAADSNLKNSGKSSPPKRRPQRLLSHSHSETALNGRPSTTPSTATPKSRSPHHKTSGTRPSTSHGVRSNNGGDKSCKEADIKLMSNKPTIRFNEMLRRLLKAIQLSADDLCTIVLCRLLLGYVKRCDLQAECVRRLRECVNLDSSNNLLRALRSRIEALSPSNAATPVAQHTLDLLARVLVACAEKDRKFLLKVRLSGLLSLLCARMLDVNNGVCSYTLLRLLVRCLRSPRNAQLFGRERQLAERFVLLLNVAATSSTEENLDKTAAPSSASNSQTMDGRNIDFLMEVSTADDAIGQTTHGPQKMARLVEVLFFISKNKRNRGQLVEHQAIPVLKTILETHFARRQQNPVHREIALITVAALRQFAKTKKGREYLVALNTLEMCERFIAQMRSTIEVEQSGRDVNVSPTTATAEIGNSSSEVQLQDSLCALCRRCLPQVPFPYSLDAFPLRYVLPPDKWTETEGADKSNIRKKDAGQQSHFAAKATGQRRQSANGSELSADDEAPSSDEDYGLLNMSRGDDSLMATFGGAEAESPAAGLQDEERSDAEEELLDAEGNAPLGSAAAVAKYSRQTEAELLMNYQHLFNEFRDDWFEEHSEEWNFINSHHEYAESSCHHANRNVQSVGRFVKIAYPEFVECPEDLEPANGGAKRAQEPICGSATSSDSLRQIIERGSPFPRRVVFDLETAKPHNVDSTIALDNVDLRRLAKQSSSCEDHLHFESRFESGNLWKAVQIGPAEYELVLAPDINQRNGLHFQWFYFEVSGMRTDVPYTFELVNCVKSASMFSRGMQPVLFSVAEAERHGRRAGWRRAGTQICYYRNLYAVPSAKNENNGCDKISFSGSASANTIGQEHMEPLKRRTRSVTRAEQQPRSQKATSIKKQQNPVMAKEQQKDSGKETKNFFTLRFTIQFPHSNDVCYLAYHFPYTYTRLQATLERLVSSTSSLSRSIHFDRQFLPSGTLGGNPVPLLTITGANRCSRQGRRLVLVTARVHPGEANSSWIMDGLIRFLLSSDPVAERCRQAFVFKLIPMLNPDGVINGSHRCSLAGQDLNRVWNDPQPHLHPTIYHAKGVIQYAVDVLHRPPFAFIDLHGHSRKTNIFAYGNNPEESWRQSDREQAMTTTGEEQRSEYARLPELLEKISSSFALKDCAFSVTKSKEFSARVATWRQFGLIRAYTMEATYWGFDQGPKAGAQITMEDLKQMGADLAQALLALSQQEQ